MVGTKLIAPRNIVDGFFLLAVSVIGFVCMSLVSGLITFYIFGCVVCAVLWVFWQGGCVVFGSSRHRVGLLFHT